MEMIGYCIKLAARKGSVTGSNVPTAKGGAKKSTKKIDLLKFHRLYVSAPWLRAASWWCQRGVQGKWMLSKNSSHAERVHGGAERAATTSGDRSAQRKWFPLLPAVRGNATAITQKERRLLKDLAC